MTSRRRITKALQVRVFDRNGGVCHICKTKIHVGKALEVAKLQRSRRPKPETGE